MDDINTLDIKKLRQEAERDLEALRRVEAMLERQRNGSAAAPTTTAQSLPTPSLQSTSSANSDSQNVGLKARVGEIVRNSGESQPTILYGFIRKRQVPGLSARRSPPQYVMRRGVTLLAS